MSCDQIGVYRGAWTVTCIQSVLHLGCGRFVCGPGDGGWGVSNIVDCWWSCIYPHGYAPGGFNIGRGAGVYWVVPDRCIALICYRYIEWLISCNSCPWSYLWYRWIVRMINHRAAAVSAKECHNHRGDIVPAVCVWRWRDRVCCYWVGTVCW